LSDFVIGHCVIGFLMQSPNHPITQLLRFFVRRVLAATPAKFAELQTTSGLLFVLGCRIIALFAISAL